MGTAAVRGLVTWSPGHLVMFDESMSVTRANTFTLNHSDAFGIIWQCPRMGMRATIPWSSKALCAFLQSQSLNFRVVFQFQSGSSLRRLPRNIQVGLVGLCALADKCFHHENHGFKLLTYISWLRMLRYQFWYEFDMDLRLQFDDFDYMTGDNERPRDFRPRKPLWRPQLVQRRQGLTVRNMTRQHVMSCVK